MECIWNPHTHKNITIVLTCKKCLIPNIVCFPSSHCVGASVIKNWEPFVFGPEFAIDNIPAPKNEIHTMLDQSYVCISLFKPKMSSCS